MQVLHNKNSFIVVYESNKVVVSAGKVARESVYRFGGCELFKRGVLEGSVGLD